MLFESQFLFALAVRADGARQRCHSKSLPMETTYYAYPTHEFFITLGRLWFERLNDELWKFAQGLSEWLYHLDANPTPN